MGFDVYEGVYKNVKGGPSIFICGKNGEKVKRRKGGAPIGRGKGDFQKWKEKKKRGGQKLWQKGLWGPVRGHTL